MILYHQLPPGASIQESALAEQLKISITPVREALNRLESDGLVERTPWIGTSVRTFTEDEIRVLYDIRITLEEMALQRAAPNIVDEDIDNLRLIQKKMMTAAEKGDILSVDELNEGFHGLILDKAENRWLKHVLTQLQDVLFMLRYPVTKQRGGSQTHQEHIAIIEALSDGTPEEAVSNMEKHVKRVRDDVIEFYSSKTGLHDPMSFE
jgi:DNA-binding GntR family transcriptional regulator